MLAFVDVTNNVAGIRLDVRKEQDRRTVLLHPWYHAEHDANLL